MNLFGRKTQQKAQAPVKVDPVEAIRKLRESLDTLEKREAHISKRVDLTLAEAKQKAAKKDKRGALFALKRKKLYEEEITKLQGARITLDSQISALESSVVNIETFNAMKGGAQALKAIRGNIDSDKVDEMMDEMQEEKDIHDQIADAIARPMGDPFDDDELLQELAELEEQELAAQAQHAPSAAASTSIGTATQLAAASLPIGGGGGGSSSSSSTATSSSTVFNLPTAPVTAINVSMRVAAESEEERQLQELQASMMA